jgi:uncharacterized repeat protein (TIGR03843 family)
VAHRRTRKPADGGDEIRQPAGTSWSPSMAGLVDRLSTAKVVQARPIMWGSNSTFLVTLEDPCAGRSHAIYKPRRGEAPLWDFPNGSLYRREVATYLVSESIGWSLVPPTVARDGPHGVGSMQLFIEHDPQTYFVSPAERDRAASEQIALLDWVLNNADRKSEHCIQDLAGRTWAIDHGLTFHVEPKLRTVIWDFAGEPISADLLTDLTELCHELSRRGELRTSLRTMVTENEVDAVIARLSRLLRARMHPDPGYERRRVPWSAWWP